MPIRLADAGRLDVELEVTGICFRLEGYPVLESLMDRPPNDCRLRLPVLFPDRMPQLADTDRLPTT